MDLPRFYTLAIGMAPREHAGDVEWPYEISLCFDGFERPVGFAEGSGHCSAGNVFTAEEALREHWRQHYVLAQGEWLIPYVHQLAQGIVPPRDALIALATQRLGRVPDSFVRRIK